MCTRLNVCESFYSVDIFIFVDKLCAKILYGYGCLQFVTKCSELVGSGVIFLFFHGLCSCGTMCTT